MGKFVVVDIEMCQVPNSMFGMYGLGNETIQIGAVLLDDAYRLLDKDLRAG